MPDNDVIPIRDERFVPPTKRFSGRYPIEGVKNAIRGAGAAGVDPELLIAMMIQEGELTPYGHQDEDYFADQGRHLRMTAGNAARVGPQPLERLIQSYNGLGSPAQAFRAQGQEQAYGGQSVAELPPNFYGHRVMDVKENVVGASPALQGLLKTTQYQPRLEPLDMDSIMALSDDLDRQRRQPQVSQMLRRIR